MTPCPTADLRRIFAVFVNIFLVINERVANGLLDVGGPRAQLRQTVDHVLHEMISIYFIQHAHIERRGRRALFLVTAHVEIVMVGTAVGEKMKGERKDGEKEK